MSDPFSFDVFLSHSQKDKDIVRPLAERLKKDGIRVWLDEWELKPGDSIPAKIEEGLERSRVLVLCMSANAFGSEWSQLESYTFRFRDPLNKERRFIPLRLDAAPMKGSLAKLQYINWMSKERKQAYARLLEACQSPDMSAPFEAPAVCMQPAVQQVQIDYDAEVRTYAFSQDAKLALTGGTNSTICLWDLKTGNCQRVFKGHTGDVLSVSLSSDQRHVLSGGQDGTVRLWDVETGRCERLLAKLDTRVWCVTWSTGQYYAFAGAGDRIIRMWNLDTGSLIREFNGHNAAVGTLACSGDSRFLLSGADDKTLRLWNVNTGQCIRILEGHTGHLWSVDWSADQRYVLSGAEDHTLRIWQTETGNCLRVLLAHTSEVRATAWSTDQRYALSGSQDRSVSLWQVETGRKLCLLEGHVGVVTEVAWTGDQRSAVSGDSAGRICKWDLSDYLTDAAHTVATTIRDPTHKAKTRTGPAIVTGDETMPSTSYSPAPDQVQYTNAKVLLVGDTSSGKTGLAHRLATGVWKPSDGSTVGAWSTQWALPDASAAKDLEHEIWLWDFGGQADQRLVHQLYMDRTALILLLFDADKEDVLPGLREWQTALRRCVPAETPLLLVAGRIDVGFRASRAKLQGFAAEKDFRFFETSAKDGTNCNALSRAIAETIPWDQMEKRTSPRIFKLIRDEILKLRDEGQVLHTFKELRELLWQRLPDEQRFSDEILNTVIGLLDGPGAVKELDYGTYILLQPEWINTYAQAVIRTLRQEHLELGALPLRSIAEGKLLFQTVDRDGGIVEVKRLPEAEERVVLREMERQLEERGLCLRQGDKLVFPSHCGRERPAITTHPSVFVSYAIQGYLDEIYATLVAKLAGSESFKLKELWRDAADFETLDGTHHMGIKLTREAAGSGDISIYFAPGVTKQEQVIFANYIHAHLEGPSEQVQRLRYYVCPHCHTPKGNPQVLMQKLLDKKKQATVECDNCEKRFDLWDDLEKLFASSSVRQQVEGLQVADIIRLDSRRKGKLLALEVGSRITSADQKCFEIPATEDEGIDMELEFTDDDGKGTGIRLYLQLKSGNSHLRKLKSGAEIFDIKEPRWVDYWLKQDVPVMLVIGTFSEEDERFAGKDKLEFAEVRWMEIRDYLKRESEGGKKAVKQIVFEGERLDLMSVRRWRDRALTKDTS